MCMKTTITAKIYQFAAHKNLALDLKVQSALGVCSAKATAGQQPVLTLKPNATLAGSQHLELWIRQLTLLKSTLAEYQDNGVIIMGKLMNNVGVEISFLDL